MLNYRYQLFDKEDWAAVTPRISLIVPTGNKALGLGDGYWGMQFNLPASRCWSEWLVTHFNAGLTYSFDIDSDNNYKHIRNYFTGLSLIYLLDEKFNMLIESIISFNAHNKDGGGYYYLSETMVVPGFRNAVNIGDLQIVTGLAVPFTFTSHDSGINAGLFFFLSFEHPL